MVNQFEPVDRCPVCGGAGQYDISGYDPEYTTVIQVYSCTRCQSSYHNPRMTAEAMSDMDVLDVLNGMVTKEINELAERREDVLGQFTTHLTRRNRINTELQSVIKDKTLRISINSMAEWVEVTCLMQEDFVNLLALLQEYLTVNIKLLDMISEERLVGKPDEPAIKTTT